MFGPTVKLGSDILGPIPVPGQDNNAQRTVARVLKVATKMIGYNPNTPVPFCYFAFAFLHGFSKPLCSQFSITLSTVRQCIRDGTSYPLIISSPQIPAKSSTRFSQMILSEMIPDLSTSNNTMQTTSGENWAPIDKFIEILRGISRDLADDCMALIYRQLQQQAMVDDLNRSASFASESMTVASKLLSCARGALNVASVEHRKENPLHINSGKGHLGTAVQCLENAQKLYEKCAVLSSDPKTLQVIISPKEQNWAASHHKVPPPLTWWIDDMNSANELDPEGYLRPSGLILVTFSSQIDDLLNKVLNKLEISEHAVPYVQRIANKSWLMVVNGSKLLDTQEKLDQIGCHVELEYDPTAPDRGEVNVYGEYTARRRACDRFFAIARDAIVNGRREGPRQLFLNMAQARGLETRLAILIGERQKEKDCDMDALYMRSPTISKPKFDSGGIV